MPGPVGETPSGTARSYLLTVLGDLVWPAGGQVWTSSLVTVLARLGFEERAARQAIARAAKAGWISPQRHGRATRWTLAPRLVAAFEEGTRRVDSLSEPFEGWDGHWLILMVTIPQDQRASRQRLYRRLTWAGLGSPWAGVWLTPHTERAAAVGAALAEQELRSSSLVTVGTVEHLGLTTDELVAASWDLTSLAEDYAAVERTFLSAGRPTDLLADRVRMRAALQQFQFRDPQLPLVLAPDWIGRRVAGRLGRLVTDSEQQVFAEWSELDAAGS